MKQKSNTRLIQIAIVFFLLQKSLETEDIIKKNYLKLMTKSLISHAYVARSANGSQTHRAVGIAAIVFIPKIFLLAAAHPGTHLKHTDFALDAFTSGVGHLVYLAANGLCMKIGIQMRKNRFQNPTRTDSFFSLQN